MNPPNAPHPLLSRSPLVRGSFAVGLFAIALAVRLTMGVNDSLPFATFYPTTVLAFYLCGVWPGMLTAMLSAGAGYFLFSTPEWTWASDWKAVVALASYLLFTALVAWLVRKLQLSFDTLRVTLDRLRETSADLKDLYDRAPCAYYSLDGQGRFIQANAVALELIGRSREETIGILGPTDFYSEEGREFFSKRFDCFKTDGKIGPHEFDLVRSDGATRRVVMSATVVNDEAGRFVKTRSIMCDITDLHHAQQELRRLARQQQAMLDNDLVGIVKVRDRRDVWKNRALDIMFGYEPGEMNQGSSRLLYQDDATFAAVGEAAYSALARGENFRTQVKMRRKNGDPMWVDMSGMLLDEKTGESLWMMLDITRLKEREERVEQLAFHDSLTGLPNRLLLSKLLRQSLLSAERGSGLLAVCFLDLNGFKGINDRFGHAAGDRLLKVVSGRLREVTRGSDIVARLAGDEFVMVLTALESREQCREIIGRALTAVSQPVSIDSTRSVNVSASIGVAYYPVDGRDADTLLSAADEAMYKMKHGGRTEIERLAG